MSVEAIQSNDIMSLLFQAGYSLRYEVTCGLVLLLLWLVGQLAMLRQKRSSKLLAKAKSQSHVHRYADKPSANKRPYVKAGKTAEAQMPAAHWRDHASEELAEHLGPIDRIAPERLCDPTWLVPQVTLLCRTQVQRALDLYRAGMSAGLQIQDIPAENSKKLFIALVTSAIRIAKTDDAIEILRQLRQDGPGVEMSLFVSTVKLCTSKHLFAECLAFYDFMAEDPEFELTDKAIWSCLLFCAVEVRAYQRCSNFFDQLKAGGPATLKDYGNMVRLASLQGDWALSLSLVREMRAAEVDIDNVIYNTALATCVGADQVDQARGLLDDMRSTEGAADVITYNTLMKGYAKAGRMDECHDLFLDIKKQGIVPSQVTYGILLDGYINENQLDRAAGVFSTMSSEGCTMNTVLYTTLIKGFARAGEVDHAMKVYEQMQGERSVSPDLITFSILIKANCDADRLGEALKLLNAMLLLKLRPDEVVFNNLLSGCARNANLELGKRLYSDMIASGVRPSNATFSILIRLYHQCKVLEEAVVMMRDEPTKQKVDVEPRLFLQLLQSCIRERQGRRAIEVYEMFVQHSLPTVSAHSSMITKCVQLNMFDTAAEICTIAAEKGARINAPDANALLDGAMKKQKTQIAQEIAAAMCKLGLTVDPKIMDQAGRPAAARRLPGT